MKMPTALIGVALLYEKGEIFSIVKHLRIAVFIKYSIFHEVSELCGHKFVN